MEPISGHNSRRALLEARTRSLAEFVTATPILFLQACYSQRPPGVNEYHYDDDENKTELLIADDSNEFLEAKETRPGLIITRGPLGWLNTAMSGDSAGRHLPSGTTSHADLIQGSFGVSAVSRQKLESQQLASDAWMLFKAFQKPLRQLGLHNVKVAQMSPTSLVEQEGYGKLWITTVSVMFHVGNRWVLEPEALARMSRLVMEWASSVGEDDGDFVQAVTLKEDM